VEKAGAIPIGRRRRRRLQGIVSLGEAAMIQPPLMVTAFNEILEYSEPITARISQALDNSTGIPALPRSFYTIDKRPSKRAEAPRG
jgi:hypothetical protein